MFPRALKTYSMIVMGYGAARKIPILYHNQHIQEYNHNTKTFEWVPLLLYDKMEIILFSSIISHYTWIHNARKDLRYMEAWLRGYDVHKYGFKPIQSMYDLILE